MAVWWGEELPEAEKVAERQIRADWDLKNEKLGVWLELDKSEEWHTVLVPPVGGLCLVEGDVYFLEEVCGLGASSQSWKDIATL